MDEKTLKKLLGEKIKFYRKRYNLTQELLGEKLCRNQKQISLIENGASFPTPETIVKIANLFECQISDLFNFDAVEETKNIKKELEKIICVLPEEKLKTLYVIGKNL